MPQQQIIPTWLAWNNCNFPTQSGIQDLRTGQDFPAGGLNAGDYFDATEKEANNASALINGQLHSGRYRLVQVDSAATVANVKTGTVGYSRAGSFVQGVIITVPGTGATPGTYTIGATPGSGGGSGAVIQVVVSAGGIIVSAALVQGGFNYVAVPTFPLTVTGTTGGTVAAQLNNSPNLVTSFDQAVTQASLVRPVVFLNSITPGNFGFIQELGIATVLANATLTSNTANAWVSAKAAGAGTVDTTVATGSPTGTTIGQAIDLPVAGQLFKAYLSQSPTVQD
jgi:hypothetical protein